MASYLPPTEELPIFDNQVFDSNNSTALTYADAKKYFLTYPVAQGTSTITDLIATSISYLSPLSGSFFNIGTNQVSGGTIRIGPTGGASGVSVHCGNIDFKNNTINNANNATGGDLSICNSQTSGILNIGTGARTIDGNINIGTGSGATANKVNIGGAGTVTTFTNGLTLPVSKYITTTSSTTTVTAPSGPLQVGCVVSGSSINPATMPTSDNVSSYGSIVLKAGTWVITATRQLNSTSGTTKLLFSFGDTLRANVLASANDYLYGITSIPLSTAGVSFGSYTTIVSLTSGNDITIYLNITPTYTSIPASSTANFKLTATRIA